MSTINAAIPLAAQAPQQPDMAAQYGKLLALQNMQQQGQVQAQQMEENQIKLQQMKQSAKDSATARKILAEAGGDLKAAAPLLIQALGPAALTIVDEFTKREQSLATLDETKRKTALEKMNVFSGAVDDVMSLPPDQRPQAWENKKSVLIQSGHMDQEQAQGLPIWDDELMLGKGNELKQTISDLELRSKKAAADKAEQDLIISKQTATGTTPMTPYQKATLEKPTNMNDVELYLKAAKGDATAQKALKMMSADKLAEAKAKAEASGVGVAGFGGTYTGETPGVKPGRNDSVLIGLPMNEVDTIKKMTQGKMPMPTGRAQTDPYWRRLMQLASVYEPGFDWAQWRKRLDTQLDFQKGNSMKQVRSMNTLIKHLGSLWDAADRIGGSPVKMYNRGANLLREEFGSKELKPWDTFATMAGTEMATLLKGGAAPSQPEIEEQAHNFDRNDAKDVKKEAILNAVEGAFGRFDGVIQAWTNAGLDINDYDFLNPGVLKTLKTKFGIDAEKKYGLTPKGGHTAPGPQATAAPAVDRAAPGIRTGDFASGFRIAGSDDIAADSRGFIGP